MLMDEPDSALDFLNRHMVLSKISELIKEENKVGLITLHDPNFAMAYCDRLFMLKQGNIVGELDMARGKPRRGAAKAFAYIRKHRYC